MLIPAAARACDPQVGLLADRDRRVAGKPVTHALHCNLHDKTAPFAEQAVKLLRRQPGEARERKGELRTRGRKLRAFENAVRDGLLPKNTPDFFLNRQLVGTVDHQI